METALFYNNLTVIDFAYLDRVRGPVGDSIRIDVLFEGELDSDGIIFDFSYAKKKVKEIIDREVDHRLVVPKKYVEFSGELVLLDFVTERLSLSYMAPAEAFTLLEADDFSYKDLISYLEKIICEEMPKNVKRVVLSYHHEDDKDHSGYFSYTHGLKAHYGNCQRLLHGHRSTLRVFESGLRRTDLEKEMMHKLFKGSIHFAYLSNVANIVEIRTILNLSASEKLIGSYNSPALVNLEYRSSQGLFRLFIPAFELYFVEEESTVENLSKMFLSFLQDEYGAESNFEVHAFEGIGKGAISHS